MLFEFLFRQILTAKNHLWTLFQKEKRAKKLLFPLIKCDH